MRLKKTLTLVVTVLMLVFASVPMVANANAMPGPMDTWKVLVLILPNASVNYGSQKQISAMNNEEVENIKEYAGRIEKWSTGRLGIKVDVKVDNEAINNQSFGQAFGYSIEPGNVQKQINNNSTNGQYDSILVVYRSTNQEGYNLIAPTQRCFGRSGDSNGATFATLPLKDTDHKLGQFNIVYPEQLLVTQLLESVYTDVSPKHSDLNGVPRFTNPGQNRYELMEYMMVSKEGTLSNYWREFTIK